MATIAQTPQAVTVLGPTTVVPGITDQVQEETQQEKQVRQFSTVLTHGASERNRWVENLKSNQTRKIYVCPEKLESIMKKI